MQALQAVGSTIIAEAEHNREHYDQCCAHYKTEFLALKGKPGGHAAMELVLAHMVELWIVRAVGAQKAASILYLYAQLEHALHDYHP